MPHILAKKGTGAHRKIEQMKNHGATKEATSRTPSTEWCQRRQRTITFVVDAVVRHHAQREMVLNMANDLPESLAYGSCIERLANPIIPALSVLAELVVRKAV